MGETTHEEHPHLEGENLGHARREEGIDPKPGCPECDCDSCESCSGQDCECEDCQHASPTS